MFDESRSATLLEPISSRCCRSSVAQMTHQTLRVHTFRRVDRNRILQSWWYERQNAKPRTAAMQSIPAAMRQAHRGLYASKSPERRVIQERRESYGTSCTRSLQTRHQLPIAVSSHVTSILSACSRPCGRMVLASVFWVQWWNTATLPRAPPRHAQIIPRIAVVSGGESPP
nr:hypothetical protein CFP56_03299 [Quercus suber]